MSSEFTAASREDAARALNGLPCAGNSPHYQNSLGVTVMCFVLFFSLCVFALRLKTSFENCFKVRIIEKQEMLHNMFSSSGSGGTGELCRGSGHFRGDYVSRSCWRLCAIRELQSRGEHVFFFLWLSRCNASSVVKMIGGDGLSSVRAT
jgi:hypothetical protein